MKIKILTIVLFAAVTCGALAGTASGGGVTPIVAPIVAPSAAASAAAVAANAANVAAQSHSDDQMPLAVAVPLISFVGLLLLAVIIMLVDAIAFDFALSNKIERWWRIRRRYRTA